ncbi:methionyl-tRNA formyltransferase [Tamilnaduibacter salinus]|uniref:Methionyl-tRNA formyltransferase n=1 Tax=Tamilnaduibacter salinus TaxID=1484056 RepID=A0A2A2I6I8_9GAMM|nr:methionyl-tRNA formyltransferase [Tamilnaduibacter salinus]PAV26894.1 methionyl-tRNA formyltransferase [Tamilnaduibacter salinus]
MRLVFAGTPDFAASALQSLIDAGHDIVGVYTQPDRPAGRGRKLRPSPVKETALAHDLPVYQPETLCGDEARAELAAMEPEVMVVAAYGLILPASILDIPLFGCLNIHASLLPRWRGAAPIQRAIAAGDGESGITIMQMDEGLDTGDMLLKRATPIHDDETGQSLHDRLAGLGGDAIVEALERLSKSQLLPEEQDDSLATYARKLDKSEGALNWHRPAYELDRLVRAFTPFPGAFTHSAGDRVRLHAVEPLSQHSDADPGTVLRRERDGIDVACGEGALRLQQVQLPGSRAQSVSDLINGGRDCLQTGEVLT